MSNSDLLVGYRVGGDEIGPGLRSVEWIWSGEGWMDDKEFKASGLEIDPKLCRIHRYMIKDERGLCLSCDTEKIQAAHLAEAKDRLSKSDEYCELYPHSKSACLDGNFSKQDLQDILTILNAKQKGEKGIDTTLLPRLPKEVLPEMLRGTDGGNLVAKDDPLD